jgi:hypothetical protein
MMCFACNKTVFKDRRSLRATHACQLKTTRQTHVVQVFHVLRLQRRHHQRVGSERVVPALVCQQVPWDGSSLGSTFTVADGTRERGSDQQVARDDVLSGSTLTSNHTLLGQMQATYRTLRWLGSLLV